MSLSNLLIIFSSSFMALFPVINPLGNGFVVNGFFTDLDPQQRKAAIQKLTFNFIMIGVGTLVIGHLFLLIFGLAIPVIQLGGGILICKTAMELLGDSGSTDKGRGISDAYAAGQGMAADHVKGRDRNSDGADQHGAGGGVHRSAESGRQSIRNRGTVSSCRGGMPEASGEFPVRLGSPARGTYQYYDGSLQNLRIAFYRTAHGEASDHLECRSAHRHREC